MKKFLFLLLALVLSVSVSCSDDKTGDTGGSMLSVTPTEIEFEAAGAAGCSTCAPMRARGR